MNNVTYLKEPGILYDMLFALKLRFNGERLFSFLREGTATPDENEIFYKQIVDKLSIVSDELLLFFYWDEETETKTVMFKYFWDCFKDLNYTKEGLIDRFYQSLYDVKLLKKTVYQSYIPGPCPDVFSVETFPLFKDKIYNSSLPEKIKLYLIDFLLFGDDKIDRIVSEIKKADSVCRNLHHKHQSRMEQISAKFGVYQIEQVSKIYPVNMQQYSDIYYTNCCLMTETLYCKCVKTQCLLIIGLNKHAYIDTYSTEEIDLFELGRVLYEEVRIKILNMLIGREMYCAEIARELGLKNNSTLYHLRMMEQLTLISNKKSGKKIYYFINPSFINSVISHMYKLLGGNRNEESK